MYLQKINEIMDARWWYRNFNFWSKYSAHNKGKSAVTKIFIRILKNNIYKYMTSISKIVYFGKLDDIANIYNI